MLRAIQAERARRKAQERFDAELLSAAASLSSFVKAAWHILEPGQEYSHGWHIDAMCEHLEAVSTGDITRLLMNVPPGSMKSLLCGVFFPAYEWGPLRQPHLRYLGTSHKEALAIRDNLKCRRLIESDWFQERWPTPLVKDQNAKGKFENTSTGFREAMAFTSMTGSRGDRVILDDPLSVDDANSEVERDKVNGTFRESLPTRLNNPKDSAIIVVMQRLHEDDVSGLILSKDFGYEHLMIPMEFEPDRACVTSIGWEDPRREEGELMAPDRFPREVVERDKVLLGSYAAAGQFQQRPAPKGGGILRRDCWELWGNPDDADDPQFRTFPAFEFVLGSLDGAYTEKEENDPCAMTLWGVYRDRHDVPKVMLMNAWRQRLELHDLVTKTHQSCKRFKVDVLLIEAKATGHSVSQELRRLYANEGYAIELVNPGTKDKTARAYAVQPILEAGTVFAPDRSWADMVITECEQFPRGKHDDLVDTVTQALTWLRTRGYLVRAEEHEADLQELRRHRGAPPPPLYPGMGR